MRTLILTLLIVLISNSILADNLDKAIFDSPEYQRCSTEGFVAYGTARETLKKKWPKNYWTRHPYRSDYQMSFIDELYARIENENFKNHLIFGAEKFHGCMSTTNISLSHSYAQIANCFAKADVALYVQEYKAGGGGLAGTKKYAREYLKDADIYPKKMLEEVIPIVFKASSSDQFLAIRDQVFRDCLSTTSNGE